MDNGWLSRLAGFFAGSTGRYDHAIIEAVELAVKIADPDIRQVRRYKHLLYESMAGAMEYFHSMTAAIPGPVVLTSSRYHEDPLVRALFKSPEELEEVLQLSPEVRNLQGQGGRGNVTAMMTMSKEERTVFGNKQVGKLMVREVRQQAVSFYDHRMVAAAFDAANTENGIVHRGVEVLANVAMERLATLQGEKAELYGQKEYLRAMLKIFGGKSACEKLFSVPSAENRAKIEKIEKKMMALDQRLLELTDLIGRPEQSFELLEKIVRYPEEILQVRNQSFRLDWKGIRVEDASDEDSDLIHLAEFNLEEMCRFAVLVTFTLD
ncbi:hypothetical protein [Desulfogranum japonicum]|uniref:hypothetical protein n=1 Tax=Desulfogranum japonicum TaxID=231447 RepID=UPI000412967B|nr:hypothetical protein [Desulfogranum japonicum]